MYLRCAVSDAPKKWHAWLGQAEFWYNTNFHTAIGCSPFKALYGYDPGLGVSPSLSSSTQPSVSVFMTDRVLQLGILKDNLLRAQNRMKQAADRHKSDVVFQVGDKVLLKLQPYAQSSLVNRPCPKLAMKYFGPYAVLERIGPAAYKLDLPASSSIQQILDTYYRELCEVMDIGD